jgi:hypothetical protein
MQKKSPLDYAINKGIRFETIVKLLNQYNKRSTTIEKAAIDSHWDLFNYLWKEDIRPQASFKLVQPPTSCSTQKEHQKKIKKLLDQWKQSQPSQSI